MFIENFDVVFYTCIFLLPGFIIKSIVDSFYPTQRNSDSKYVFICLLYSVVNCAVCSWTYVWLFKSFKQQYSIAFWILLLLVTVLESLIIAVLIGLCKQGEFADRILKSIGISTIHSIPTAWDYCFSQQQESYMIVTLKSGKTIYGLFSTKSFASTDFEERDLYIEKTFILDNDMIWYEDEKSQGILISFSEIETIEFF